jgi:hypothetical protein
MVHDGKKYCELQHVQDLMRKTPSDKSGEISKTLTADTCQRYVFERGEFERRRKKHDAHPVKETAKSVAGTLNPLNQNWKDIDERGSVLYWDTCDTVYPYFVANKPASSGSGSAKEDSTVSGSGRGADSAN